jgi:hypothetical protein
MGNVLASVVLVGAVVVVIAVIWNFTFGRELAPKGRVPPRTPKTSVRHIEGKECSPRV